MTGDGNFISTNDGWCQGLVSFQSSGQRGMPPIPVSHNELAWTSESQSPEKYALQLGAHKMLFKCSVLITNSLTELLSLWSEKVIRSLGWSASDMVSWACHFSNLVARKGRLWSKKEMKCVFEYMEQRSHFIYLIRTHKLKRLFVFLVSSLVNKNEDVFL